MKSIQTSNDRALITVDDEDYERVIKFKWYICYEADRIKHISRNTNYDGLPTHIGRFILNYFGELWIDHKDRDKLNNQRNNLRLVEPIYNTYNRTKSTKTKYKYKGIWFLEKKNRWFARIAVNKKKIYLGCFKTSLEAAKAYNEAAVKYHGEFASLNILDKEIHI